MRFSKRLGSLRVTVDRDRCVVTLENATGRDLHVCQGSNPFALLEDDTGLALVVRPDLLGVETELFGLEGSEPCD